MEFIYGRTSRRIERTSFRRIAGVPFIRKNLLGDLRSTLLDTIKGVDLADLKGTFIDK